MAYRNCKIMIFLFFYIQQINAQWTSLNGVVQGEMRCIVQSKNNSFVYAATENGVYISPDSGNTWHKTNLFNTDVASLILRGDTLLALINLSQSISFNNSSLYRTIDYGNNWIKIDPDPKGIQIFQLFGDGSNMYVETLDSNYNLGYYHSTNGGDSWLTANFPVDNVECISIEGNNIFIGSYSGCYLSTDGGTSWSTVHNMMNLFSVAVTKGKLFISGTDALYKSTDMGNSWSSNSSIQYAQQLVISEAGIYAVGQGVKFSSDGGSSWKKLINENENYASMCANKNVCFLSSFTSEISRSTNSGLSWYLKNTNFGNRTINSLIILGKTIIAGNDYGKIYKTTDDGKNWSIIFADTNQYSFNSMILNKSAIYACTGTIAGGKYSYPAGTVYKSIDSGKTWIQLNINGNYFSSLLFKNNELFAGSWNKGLYTSTDDGKNFNSSVFSSSPITCLTANTSSIYTLTFNSLYVSKDNGLTWTKKADQGGTAHFLINDNRMIIGSSDGIYLSKDTGLTWVKKPNLTDICTFGEYKNIIFACSSYGYMYFSKDNGENWKAIGNIGYEIQSIAFRDSTIFVGMFNNILSGSVNDIITSISTYKNVVPSGYSLKQNYPNPFNPTTTIEYELPKRTNVKIDLFDMLGRKIETLVNEEQSAGKYNISFNASRLSSGIYFYTITTNDFYQTKKMVLMK